MTDQRNALRSGLIDSRKLRVSPQQTSAHLVHLLHTPLGQTPSLSELLPAWKIKSSPQYREEQDSAVRELVTEGSAATAGQQAVHRAKTINNRWGARLSCCTPCVLGRLQDSLSRPAEHFTQTVYGLVGGPLRPGLMHLHKRPACHSQHRKKAAGHLQWAS